MTKIQNNSHFINGSESPKKALKRSKKKKSLDTLAQNRTDLSNLSNASNKIGGITDNEIGNLVSNTFISDKKTLVKRARRKYFTRSMILKLVDAANRRKDIDMAKAYWRAYHCANVVYIDALGKGTSTYCKCRWCLVCASIRTAVHINRYVEYVDSWTDSKFLTLTNVTCKDSQLEVTIENMISFFSSTLEKYRVRRFRGTTDHKLVGIRKLECTYNPKTDKYHPHFHIITKDKLTADILLSEWMDKHKTAKISAQDIRNTNDGSKMELLKYETKVLYSVGDGRRIYPRSLDWIYKCIKGKHTLSKFGFFLKSSDYVDDPTVRAMIVDHAKWNQGKSDWILYSDDSALSGYIPCNGTVDLLNKSIIPF